MSGTQPYRERDRGGDRGEPNYRSNYNNRGGGGFRGRGGVAGYKPRRYWDSDDYYKDEREHGRGRRRRSYSRSRSRSRSYSSRSRSRSRTPPGRRGRSRSPQKPDETSERPPEQARHGPPKSQDSYVPTKEPSNAWSNSRMLPQEYVSQTNGQGPLAHNPVNPYGSGVDTTAYPPPSHYQQEGQPGIASINNPPPTMGFPYGQSTNLISHTQYPPPPQANLMFPHGGISQPPSVAPPPPALGEVKSTKDDGSSEGSKKKKDKRKKKKRHHSSSSSSSSSDDSSESRRRHKTKKNQGSSDSSSEDEKKESSSSSGLTSAQKDALLKQREGYQTKWEILKREIEKLKSKEDELIRNRADRQLIDENLNLQAELKGRCKAVLIVLEKIDDVLKVGNKPQPVPAEKPPRPVVPQEAPVSLQPPKVILPPPRSESPISTDGPRKGSLEYFDNRRHWCRLCNVFPETVEQMLAHFHSKEHHDQIQQLGIDEKPWHKRNSVTDSKPVSGARKAPFRGMQFFSPVEGWYCRLCNSWMGDPHCAVEHLKSDEHNSNYMNFLEEHPDWEQKWVSDRERALGTSGKQDPTLSLTLTTKKSRFDDSRSSKDGKEKVERKPIVMSNQEDLDSGKSIRVQMRNSLKGEERSGNISQFNVNPLVNEVQVTKDSGLEEWMNKPKVTVDIIDTQKFAAIVRQKHGTKEKEAKDGKGDVPDLKTSPVPPPSSSLKEKDYKKEKDDRRRPDKVELQISGREKDRGDRYRERDNRGSRRRSRSRSRSRSRERRYNRRRSRSRSRSRDRSDRDRRDRVGERERPDFKEAVKKLPMIGKMPLYGKRPAINREKPEMERAKAISAEVSPLTTLPPVGFLPKEVLAKKEPEKISLYNENSMSSSAFMYDAHSGFDHGSVSKERYSVPSSAYGQIPIDASMEEDNSKDFQQGTELTDDVPTEDSKEDKEDAAPAALPDDFQQALDIIYAVNTGGAMHPKSLVPQPVPPPGNAGLTNVPSTNGVSDEPSSVTGSTEYGGEYSANGYGNYMGYQPYQQSYDGYAPVGYDELDDGPPGVGDENPSVALARPTPAAVPPPVSETSQIEKIADKDPPPPGDDDMEDLRMLGIDVDDTAVVLKH